MSRLSLPNKAEDKFKNNWYHFGFLGIIYGLAAFTLIYHLFIPMDHNHSTSMASSHSHATKCARIHESQLILVGINGFEPPNLTVKRCSLIVFVGADKAVHNPAFGEMNHHDESNGYKEKALSFGTTNSFIVQNVGSFPLHDHLYEKNNGVINVEED